MKMPISRAAQAGDTIYIGGTPPLDEANNLIGKGDVAIQTQAVIDRLTRTLASTDMSLSNVVFVTVYLVELSHFPNMNAVYAEMFTAPYPARKVLQTPLTVAGALIEMTAVAFRDAKIVLNTATFSKEPDNDY